MNQTDPNQTQAFSMEAELGKQDRQIERSVRRIHLMITREQWSLAERETKLLLAKYPGHPEVMALAHRLKGRERDDKEEESRLRELRYSFGMNTSWSRFCWIAASLVTIGYCLYHAAIYVPIAIQHGLRYEITTLVSTGSRYSRHYEPWTHEVWIELTALILIPVAIGIIAFVFRVSKGAALWEELDASGPGSNSRMRGSLWTHLD